MINTIILAAGGSKRLKSKKSKVLHEILGKKVIEYVIDVSRSVSDYTIIIVSNSDKEIQSTFSDKNIKFAVQKEAIGTQNAVKSGLHLVNAKSVLVLCGDTPTLKEETIKKLCEIHSEESNKLTMLSVYMNEPASYGRVKRIDGLIDSIVESKDASEEELKIKEINSGVYIFDYAELSRLIDRVTNDNVQKEYYLTDLVKIFKEEGLKVGALVIDDSTEIIGVNNRLDLHNATKIIQKRINEKHMLNGVTLINPDSIFIEPDVKIGRDVTIKQCTELKGTTIVSEDSVIGPNVTIENSVLGLGVEVRDSTVLNSKIGDNTKVGPYAYIRPNSNIGQSCKIGDFVEIKNSTLGDATKVSHLSYIGDSDLGENINVGCGTIFVNYDGKNKHRSIVEDNVFIGCNTNIVSPVRIGKGAFIAAGTTVTKDVESGALCIGRVRETQRKDWVKKK